MILVKRCLYKEQKVEHKAVLSVSSSSVNLAYNSTSHQIDIQSITKKQCSKQGGVNPQLRLVCTTSTYVLSFETEADRDAIVAVLNKCQKTLEEDADMPSLIDRQRQLADDPNLQVEHAAIVGGGILSEGEFWRSRSNHHHIQSVSDKSALGQGQTAGTKIGLSNALVEAVERMDEGMARVGISKIIYDFTAQDREQIMVEKPSVRKAYLAHVPHSMSEQQFWERFVKHEYSKKASRKRELGEGVANIPDDEQLFSSRPELLPSMEKRMKKGVDPSWNISDDANSQQPWSVPISTRIDTLGVKIGRELVNDINRHAQVVLDGLEALKYTNPSTSQQDAQTTRGLVSVAGSCIVMDDLRGSVQSAKHEPLSIQDPSKYFSSGLVHHGSASTSEDRGMISKSLQPFHATNPSSLPLCPLSADVALRALLECSRGSEAYMHGSAEDQGLAAKSPDVLPHELLQSFRREALAVHELCRLYWQQKALVNGNVKNRVLAEINKRYTSLNDQRKAATGPERATVRNLLKPLIDMIDAIETS